MVLLTSAQVSVAISSTIVFFFTTALFLSGYVLQQQTVRDLRAAIKPQLQRPKTVPDLYLPSQFNEEGYLVDMVQIETRPTKQDTKKRLVEESVVESASTDKEPQEIVEAGSDDMVGATRWQKAARRKKLDEEAKQLPMMDDKPKSSRQKKPATSSKTDEKPMSRAERRKKIKEQIMAEGQGETFQGYRRRMW